MHSSTLCSVILGQWLREVGISFAQRPCTQTQKRLHHFGQFNAFLDIFNDIKSSVLNILVKV